MSWWAFSDGRQRPFVTLGEMPLPFVSKVRSYDKSWRAFSDGRQRPFCNTRRGTLAVWFNQMPLIQIVTGTLRRPSTGFCNIGRGFIAICFKSRPLGKSVIKTPRLPLTATFLCHWKLRQSVTGTYCGSSATFRSSYQCIGYNFFYPLDIGMKCFIQKVQAGKFYWRIHKVFGNEPNPIIICLQWQ